MKKIFVALLVFSSLLFSSCFSYKFSTDEIKYTETLDCITDYGLQVFQVLDEHYAFCRVLKPSETLDANGSVLTNVVVVLYDAQSNSFYENKKIMIPKGKQVVTTGVFKYKRTFKKARVFPVVVIK